MRLDGNCANPSHSEDCCPRLYYVQDTRSYVGNCAVFWAKDAAGYCCDPAEAHVFTEAEIKRGDWRDTDRPLLKSEVDRALSRHLRVDTSAFKQVKAATAAALRPADGESLAP